MSDLSARLRDAADEIDRLTEEVWQLYDVVLAAHALTEECKGGDLPPSLGALAKLESAVSLAWHSKAYQGWRGIKEWSR